MRARATCGWRPPSPRREPAAAGLGALRPRARALALGGGPACGPAAVTVGAFDGLHRGHRAILERALAVAAERGLESALLTFAPSPREFFRGAAAAPRCHALLDLSLEPRARVPGAGPPAGAAVRPAPRRHRGRGLRRRRRCATACRRASSSSAGTSASAGTRAGGADLLRARAAAWGCGFETAPTVRLDGARVSSTRARAALAAGDFALAERLLGRPYSLCAEVAAGDRRGRELGFPTANLDFPHHPALRGVFAVEARLRGGEDPAGAWTPGVANIGTRPTVDGLRLRLEVHLLDFDGDLYGRFLETRFLRRLRGEKKFASVDELRAQVAHDTEEARTFLSGKMPKL